MMVLEWWLRVGVSVVCLLGWVWIAVYELGWGGVVVWNGGSVRRGEEGMQMGREGVWVERR